MKRLLMAAALAAGLMTPAQADIVGVSRVIDGDTFETLAGVRVRLWGIDAPEMSEAMGDFARMELEFMILYQSLDCRGVDVDRYGRVVAQCFLGGRDIACEMVHRGLADDWPRYSGGHYQACY